MCDNWSSDLILKSSFFDLGVVRVHTKSSKVAKAILQIKFKQVLEQPSRHLLVQSQHWKQQSIL